MSYGQNTRDGLFSISHFVQVSRIPQKSWSARNTTYKTPMTCLLQKIFHFMLKATTQLQPTAQAMDHLVILCTINANRNLSFCDGTTPNDWFSFNENLFPSATCSFLGIITDMLNSCVTELQKKTSETRSEISRKSY